MWFVSPGDSQQPLVLLGGGERANPILQLTSGRLGGTARSAPASRYFDKFGVDIEEIHECLKWRSQILQTRRHRGLLGFVG